MSFDHPRSSPKSPRKLPAISNKHVQNTNNIIEKWTLPLSPGFSGKLSVFFSRLPPAAFPTPEKATLFSWNSIRKPQKPTKQENETDAHQKMIAIRLINSAPTSVNNPNKELLNLYKILKHFLILNSISSNLKDIILKIELIVSIQVRFSDIRVYFFNFKAILRKDDLLSHFYYV